LGAFKQQSQNATRNIGKTFEETVCYSGIPGRGFLGIMSRRRIDLAKGSTDHSTVPWYNYSDTVLYCRALPTAGCPKRIWMLYLSSFRIV
jgi:hypothetical protein